jgi:SAM-dependent methyltransferase
MNSNTSPQAERHDGDLQSIAEARQLVANRYYDGPHYDLRYATYTHDIEFWKELGKRHGPDVLELATGTGRIAFPLADAGCRVTGVDLNASMLRQAEANRGAQQGNPAFVEADMRFFTLPQRFDFVLLPCSSIAHLLSDADVIACLRQVRLHLKDSGVFALDVLNPAVGHVESADDVWRPRFSYPDPDGAGAVEVRGRRRYDADSQIMTDELDYHFTREGRREHVCRRSRMFFPGRLERLLDVSGFTVAERWGGFQGEPYGRDAPTQVLVCRPTADPVGGAGATGMGTARPR